MSLRPVPGYPIDRQLVPKGALFSVFSLNGPIHTFHFLSCDRPVCTVVNISTTGAEEVAVSLGHRKGREQPGRGCRGWIGRGNLAMTVGNEQNMS